MLRVSRSCAVRPADRDHQRQLPLPGGRATRGDRHRGRHPARADARAIPDPRSRPGAAFAPTRDGDPVMVALAADHVVTDTAAFAAACRTARGAAAAGHIVTFGVRPDRAATEYGYIRPGAAIGDRPVRGRRNSSKSRKRPRQSAMSRTAISGTPATSCSALARSSTSTGDSSPTARPRSTAAVERAGTRSRLRHARSARHSPSAHAKSVDYAVMEKTQARRGGAGLFRLVGRRFMACGLGACCEGRRRQCRARASGVPRCAEARTSIVRQGAGGAVRGGESGGGGEPGRGAGHPPRRSPTA